MTEADEEQKPYDFIEDDDDDDFYNETRDYYDIVEEEEEKDEIFTCCIEDCISCPIAERCTFFGNY